jgi:hypothetical protein
MQRQIQRLVLFVSGFILASIFWNSCLDFVADKPVPDAVFSSSIIDLKEKILIRNKNTEKIIFVGGSNVAFGIDSIEIKKAFGIESINFGCMAGIGPEVLLSKIENHTSGGDIIIFCWEFGLYRFKRTGSNFTYLNLIYGPHNALRSNYPIMDKIRLNLRYPTSHIRTSIAVAYNPFADPEIFRCSWNFDEHGNVRSIQEQIVKEKELINSPLSSLMTELTITNDVKEMLTDFVHSCRNKNIKLLSTWPNTFNNPKYIKNKVVEKNFLTIKDFWQNLDVPMIGMPEDSMLAAEFFHDTYYHLNSKGVKIRTKKLIDNLKPQLFKHAE